MTFQYKMYADAADTFHDIVEGDNICPEEYCGPNCKGYKATKGWDPVTGLGTPNAARMEAYVNQLLDELLAKRAARAAAAATTTVDEPTPAAPTPNPRYYVQRKQPLPPTINSLYLARNNTQRWQKSKQQLSALGVQPDEVWAGLAPLAIGFVGNDTLVVALEASILTLSYPSLQVMGNCSIDAAFSLSGFASTGSYVSVLLIDELYGTVQLNGLNPMNCMTVSSTELKYPTNLLGINAQGKLALTSTGGSLAVLFDTSSGERRSVLSNSSWAVTGGAINSVNGDVWVAWGAIVGRRLISAVDVFQGTTKRFTFSLPGTYAEAIIESVAIDASGTYAYVFYVALTQTSIVFIIEQVKADSGESVNSWTLPDALPPTTTPTVSGRDGEVYYMSLNQLVVLTASGVTTAQLGQYPFIPNPSDVAVTRDGDILVALTEADQIIKLNTSGQIVFEFPAAMPECELEPFLDVTVDYEGNVYQPLCNSTVLIYDRDGNLVTQVYTGANTIPRSVAAGPRSTLFFTDDSNQKQVTHIERDGTVINKFTTASATWLFTVKYNWRADSIYVTDILGGKIYQWAINSTGAPTSTLDVTAAAGQAAQVYSLALDHTNDQMIVSAEMEMGGALLWFDMDGNLLGKNYTFVEAEATGVAVSMDGSRVYANDLFNSAIYVFYQDGQKIDKVERRTAAGTTTTQVATD